MESNFLALILVLFVGALSSCANAYYFPDGPPHRPARQAATNASNHSFHPEPRQVVTRHPEPREEDLPMLLVNPVPSSLSDKPVAIPTLTAGDTSQPETLPPQPLNDEPPHKPEPRGLTGLQMVPKRRDSNIFEVSKQRQSSSCGQNYAFSQSGESVILQSPNYDREYPNNIKSSTCFSSPSGTTMSVACDDFNVENSRTCSYDFMGISLSGNPSSISKYCGKGTVRSSPSSGNSLAIVFQSDSSNPGSSRRSPYRFRCTVTVSGGSSENPTTLAPTPPGNTGNCTCGRKNDGSRIVGGTDAKLNQFPWRCYMRTKRYSFFCGCSIISDRWILTAAHCTAAVMPLPSDDVLYVVVGDHDRSTSTESASQQVAVESVHDHKQYNDETMDNDVSLLKLSRTLTFSNAISPICLPFNYVNDNFNGETVTASGWGTTSQGGQVSNTLKEVDLPVLTTEQCSQYYRGQITERMICTYNPGKDTCQGDSGGSIDLNRNGRWFHIGVVSWGIGCAKQNNPGVYAKTTKFLDWIRDTTSGESFCRA